MIWGNSTRCAACSGAHRSLTAAGKSMHTGGYPMTRVNGKYIFDHILVMEERLGRKLLPGENVHHRNGVKDDNRDKNLELWVKPQPSGVRAADALEWAREIVETYGPLEAAGNI